MREWRGQNREKRTGSRRRLAAEELGVTVETLERLMSARCDVCGEYASEVRSANSAYVRRDTGAVVGTVCHKCATGIGYLGHDTKRLAAAIALLTSTRDYRRS